MSSIFWKCDFFLQWRHTTTFEIGFQIICGSCYDFHQLQNGSKIRSAYRHEADTLCAAQIDSKVKEEEETFVILVTEHNLSYSWGDALMKFIKGTFHRLKSCQEYKR